MMMQEKPEQFGDPKEQALKDILKVIMDTGLMDSLDMPTEEPALGEASAEEMLSKPEEEIMDEMEDESEKLDRPVSLSITQLGAMKKPEKAREPSGAAREVSKAKAKSRAKRRRGK